MSGIVSGALAGMAAESNGDSHNDDYDKMQERHRDLIKELMPKMLKIQRELRGRRFREVQAKLTESVKLLTKFQDEKWPPRSAPPMPDWMQKSAAASEPKNPVLNSPEMDAAFSADMEDDAATTTTADGTVTTTNDTDEEGSQKATVPPDIMDVSIANESLSIAHALDEDPQVKYPMHEACIVTAEALAMGLLHPQKSNKASEASLEVLTILLTNRYITGRAGGKNDREGVTATSTATSEDSKEGAAAGTESDQQAPPKEKSLLHQVIEGVTRCSESSVEAIQNGVVKTMLAITVSPKTAVHEASMLMAIRATFHVYLITKSPECKKAAKSALFDMLRSVFNRMESYDAMMPKLPQTEGEDGEETNANGNGNTDGKIKADFTQFTSQYHTDGYLLFRALCKLSSKALPGEDGVKTAASTMMSFVSNQSVDPLALNSKILSLELLQMVLEYSGQAFCTGEKFIYAVQNYLCVSLLKNCMSSNTQVAYFSQKIFLMLVYKFKAHLKAEIEVFMSNIFLRVLESPNSSFEQKALVLEALRALCSDPGLLTQIFLNYDCDMDANNLYKDIVQNLTKLSARSTASPNSNLSKKEIEQDFELSLAGNEVLVSILKAFLKALDLPGGEDEEEGDSAAARLRQSLQIDVGMAAKPSANSKKKINQSMHGEAEISQKDFKSPVKTSNSEAHKIVGAFETKRAQQQNFETGVVKFSLSMKNGLKYFIANGFVELDAKAVALFFIENKDKLEKTQIGEALGREPDGSFVKEKGVDAEKGGSGFFFSILNHYADHFDFAGMMFDDAIRLFQSGFRLPGEAQKIDRIMEKFAERFTRQNLDVFPSADTAFILAFSVIMLNTDLHNPNIKEEKKMTQDSFIRNNRGIADGEDLPKVFLQGVFNRIKAHPFSLKEDDEAREKMKVQNLDSSIFFEAPSFFGASAEDRKKEKFKKEREDMMSATEHLFKKKQKKGKAGRSSTANAHAQLAGSIDPSDVVKPMFDVTWGPLLGTLSQVLECSTDERSIAVCLNGFVYAVRIAAHSRMSLARDTFVNSLAKFTFLGSLKELRHKNIESIRTLLSIAVMDGEYLDESWGPVLQCISQLARLRLFASGLESDETFFNDDADKSSSRHNGSDHDLADGAGLFRSATKAETQRETEQGNSRAVVAAFNEVLIDKVFSSTVNLSARAIAHFIEQLVEVSAMEIAGNSKRGISGVGASSRSLGDKSKEKKKNAGDDGPRIFSLQKLVEVADFNMAVRPRIAWAQVWEILADHFANVGCNENSQVSIFAIDSLKQLSFKFLEKPERSEFSFQRIFLKPFLEIMENSKTREDIRELVLRCIDNMIRTMSQNLRSGWKIFFSILTASASDPSERINTLGLAILQRLLDEHLHQLCRLHEDDEVVDPEKADDENRELTQLEKHNRNANVEDFGGLCRASLAFVQTDYTSPLPIGLSMRALCHTACYADLIAEKQVLAPVSCIQSSDPDQPGYTYAGLEGQEALDMVLWRTLLDGLGNGIKSTLLSNAGGVGCLTQRGSVLALRAILLRHGPSFSTAQWKAILTDTLVPAIQAAAESDKSPVIAITSESPPISSVDFLAEPQALPPAHDDVGLRKFADQASSAESAPARPLGEAELLVEASFADMRHGGDGNLSRAFELAKNDMQAAPSEQPFPDSWVATTGPIALGMLTDIITEIALKRGAEGRDMLWPPVLSQLQAWTIGDANRHGDAWQPCEALVRVACREFHRFPLRLQERLPSLSVEERAAWPSVVFSSIASTLSQIVGIETGIMDELVRAKLAAYGPANGASFAEEEEEMGVLLAQVIMYTPYGKGSLIERRKEEMVTPSGEVQTFTMNVIKLNFGATLYKPAPGSFKPKKGEEPTPAKTEEIPPVTPPRKTNGAMKAFVPKSPSPVTRESWWSNLVPALKVRCVGVYCLQHYLYDLLASYVPLASEEDIILILDSLNESRRFAADASQHEDLSHAFQEAMFSSWGDGVEEVEQALSNTGGLSHRRGSEMFFLTQEAGAANDVIHMLSILYKFDGDGEIKWDRESFAETHLLSRIEEVLGKFVASEKRDGHLIDPNVWRNASESGGKLAIYCTSFAVVVVSILNVMLAMSPEKFAKHMNVFFPVLCSLVCVQSDEIRSLVKDVLEQKIAPKLSVSIK